MKMHMHRVKQGTDQLAKERKKASGKGLQVH